MRVRLLTACLALAIAPPALAQPIVELRQVHRNDLSGPRLAGSSIVYAQRQDGSERWTIRRADGRETAEVGTVESSWFATPATTSQALAFDSDLALQAAPWGAPLRPIDSICGNGGDPAALAASGRLVAYIVCLRDPGADRSRYVLRVRDVADGRLVFERPLDGWPTNGMGDVALAGNLLGHHERQFIHDGPEDDLTSLVVYDLTTGSRRVAFSTTERIKAWDLRADGAIAVALEREPWLGPNGALGWVDAAGTWHELLGREIMGYQLRFRGDAVAVELPRVSAPGWRSTLALVDLDGRIRPAARFDTIDRTSAGTRLGSFDYDGERLTWSERRCLAVRMHLVTVPAPRVVGPQPRRPCWAADLMTTRAEVGPRGRFLVQVAARKPATGEVSVTVAGRTATEAFTLQGAQRRRTLRLDLGAQTARLLRRRGPMVAEAVVTAQVVGAFQRPVNRTDLTLAAGPR